MKTILAILMISVFFALPSTLAGETTTTYSSTTHTMSSGSSGSTGVLGIRRRIDRRQARRAQRQMDRQNRRASLGWGSGYASFGRTSYRSHSSSYSRSSNYERVTCPDCSGMKTVPKQKTLTEEAPSAILTPIRKDHVFT